MRHTRQEITRDRSYLKPFALLALGLALAAAAPAQRVSLTGLMQRINELKAAIAVEERKPLLSEDGDADPGLVILGAAQQPGLGIYIFGEGFGERGGKESVLLGGVGGFESLTIEAWDDFGIIVEEPNLPPAAYVLLVSNEVTPPGGGDPVLAVGRVDLNVGAQGPEGPIGPTGPEGERGPRGPVGPEGPEGRQGDPGEQGPPGPKGAKGATGAVGPAGAAGASAPLLDGRWVMESGTCGNFESCNFRATCQSDEIPVMGACGDSGSATNVVVISSGRDRSDPVKWLCRVANNSLTNARSVTYGAFCIKR